MGAESKKGWLGEAKKKQNLNQTEDPPSQV